MFDIVRSVYNTIKTWLGGLFSRKQAAAKQQPKAPRTTTTNPNTDAPILSTTPPPRPSSAPASTRLLLPQSSRTSSPIDIHGNPKSHQPRKLKSAPKKLTTTSPQRRSPETKTITTANKSEKFKRTVGFNTGSHDRTQQAQKNPSNIESQNASSTTSSSTITPLETSEESSTKNPTKSPIISSSPSAKNPVTTEAPTSSKSNAGSARQIINRTSTTHKRDRIGDMLTKIPGPLYCVSDARISKPSKSNSPSQNVNPNISADKIPYLPESYNNPIKAVRKLSEKEEQKKNEECQLRDKRTVGFEPVKNLNPKTNVPPLPEPSALSKLIAQSNPRATTSCSEELPSQLYPESPYYNSRAIRA